MSHLHFGELVGLASRCVSLTLMFFPDNQSEDPLKAGNNVSSVLNPSSNLTIDHIMGIQCIASRPSLSRDTIKPFDAKKANSVGIFDSEPKPTIPNQAATQSDMWAPQEHPEGVSDDDDALWVIAKTAWKLKSDLGIDDSSAGTSAGTSSPAKTWDYTDVVNMWSEVAKWDNGIEAIFPEEYVDSLEEYHLSAPFVVVQ